MERRAGAERRAGKETLEERVTRIEAQLVANTQLTEEIHASQALTREIHEWVGNAKGFFVILGVAGNVLKWMAAVAAAIALLWAVFIRGPGKD